MYKLVLCLAAVSLIQGCLITNCPKGGKRSSQPAAFYHRFRLPETKESSGECRRCGPKNEGRCISESICCGPKLGCLVGTPAILGQCSGLAPALLPAANHCSIGVCLSDGVCCSSDGCKIDYSCEIETTADVCRLPSPSAD